MSQTIGNIRLENSKKRTWKISRWFEFKSSHKIEGGVKER
jgi:hypothetical protein